MFPEYMSTSRTHPPSNERGGISDSCVLWISVFHTLPAEGNCGLGHGIRDAAALPEAQLGADTVSSVGRTCYGSAALGWARRGSAQTEAHCLLGPLVREGQLHARRKFLYGSGGIICPDMTAHAVLPTGASINRVGLP
ncbi:hypothetical protein B0H14DRAFT_2567739 [Mycena olivaceomarginata]|nr:hypothetical protein B0H14DRAFT_2567739 [Mycena olivaceomarginata]